MEDDKNSVSSTENLEFVIPEEAVSKEKRSISDTRANSLAQAEAKQVDAGTYEDKLKKSRGATLLLHMHLYRCGVTYLFLLVCIFITFVLVLSAYLVYKYIIYITICPTRLEEFLKEIWKVLTGASVVVFIQLLGWSIKKKADEVKSHENQANN